MSELLYKAKPSVIPPIGRVELKDKLIPVCETVGLDPNNYYAFTLATIDVSRVKKKLRELPPNLWEEQEDNVKLSRPAHDAWGIKKIIFVFCDDFLRKVLDLPWSQQDEWKELLGEVYRAIGVDETKVVRCLFASMPPGVSIPIHHDTGYWVQYAHRCHLAIETEVESVDFLVGPNEENMTKYIFDEGRIVELNNQAKHAVFNNSNINRIHLIFDYVEDHPITRHKLEPGEVVYQTRRTIDLAREIGLRKAPTFIIIGAQKCGTTSIYNYICQHPLVVSGKRRETHYFDWRFNVNIPSTNVNEHYQYYMNYFQSSLLHKHPSLITGESTPSYLFHSDIVIPRMKSICPWSKLIIMLRNPVDRAYSQYQMCIDPNGTPEQLKLRGESTYRNMTFEEVAQQEIAEIQSLNITPNSSFIEFRDKIISTRPLTHGGHSIIARGLYCFQVENWLQNYPIDQICVLSMDEISGHADKIQTCMEKIYQYLDLPVIRIQDLSIKNKRDYTPMSPEIHQMLEDFYQPFNMKLFSILGYKLIW